MALLGEDRELTGSPCLHTIHRTAAERLRQSPYLAVREIQCVVGEDGIVLVGSLPSYYLKQVAQEIATGIEGVRRVSNRIRVLGTTPRTRRREEPGPEESP